MKHIQYLFLALGFLLNLSATAQDELTLNDINFRRAFYNTGFLIDHASLLDATFTSSLGSGEQNTARFHFMAYGNFHKLETAAGLKINSKSYGFYKNTSAEVMLAKGIELSRLDQLNIGLSLGMLFNSINTAELNQYVNQEDPFLTEEMSRYRFLLGFGIAYNRNDKTMLGFSSLPSIVKTETGFYPVYIVNASHAFDLNAYYTLRPEVLVYGSNVARTTAEINVKGGFDDKLFVKMGVRTTKTLVFGGFFKSQYLTLGYVYNYNLGEYTYISPGVHNINLGVSMPEVNRRFPARHRNFVKVKKRRRR